MQFLRSVCYNSFQIPLCSIRFFTNRAKSVILFYSEVFFSQPSFSEFLIFELYKKLHSANTSELQATKKPHNYHKIAVWQKDDRIRKSPLKFCVYHYNELEGDCQAAIITELCRREKLYLSTCLLIHIKVHRSKSPR